MPRGNAPPGGKSDAVALMRGLAARGWKRAFQEKRLQEARRARVVVLLHSRRWPARAIGEFQADYFFVLAAAAASAVYLNFCEPTAASAITPSSARVNTATPLR